jgi:DNA-directed RNA polymerase subunit RPC12/RpoP|mmetsp:Transcript_32204/g.54126  ORF Transcript_32204/g.54126 Transcript_32204/m.54126 type:complete len:184 (+) Transcript_32204:145-696(+)|eukprot:CAMPEP_0174298080 /NCGR_PEP_ID=MMETSP0809-20121228/52756_1 /TAXON_ID=73025 ORGANISM="Eutreptiella gymnastica-like, Strain CCMP1594" /NCGR_SAMPLE_ID=MMETSP0809 /ASSEMBLY_ACC=CAM_ASM_000658 /LENGTH=183 /DNA_ID=CAMNT_0015402287 /DNA_START=179 /DNA_END=730 /DNA_ORIENTATION=+
MAPKKEDKKKAAKAAKAAEAQAKLEEMQEKERADLFLEESKGREAVSLHERVEVAESKLEKNRQYAHFMVEKKQHTLLQQKYQELSKTASSEKAALEKAIAAMNRTKEMLETELSELGGQYKAQCEELTFEKKRLEAEMSERGNCFVCPDCSNKIFGMIRKEGLAAQTLRREAKKQNYDLGKA